MRTVSEIDMLSRMVSSSRRAARSSSRWKRIEVWRMRSTRSNTSAPSWSRTVSPRMRPNRRISLRSLVSSSIACASSARLERSSTSEGMIWVDIVDCSSNCPAVLQSASFLTQCKIKKEAVAVSLPSSRRRPRRRPGTHNHRRSSGGTRLPCCPNETSRGMGPGLRRDDGSLDLPPGPLPIGIAQAALEDLAGVLAWQAGLDFDVLWNLVVSERGFQPETDVGDVEPRPRLRLDHRHQRLAKFRIGNAEHGAVMHTRQGVQH